MPYDISSAEATPQAAWLDLAARVKADADDRNSDVYAAYVAGASMALWQLKADLGDLGLISDKAEAFVDWSRSEMKRLAREGVRRSTR